MGILGDVDLRTVGIVLEKNGEPVAFGAGAAVLGHPAAAIAMMANIQPKFFMLFLPSMTVGIPRNGISADWLSPGMPRYAGYSASIDNRAG